MFRFVFLITLIMKYRITISKVVIDEKIMIQILKYENRDCLDKILQMKGSVYHKSSGNHYIPYSQVSYTELKRICPHIIIHSPGTSEPTNSKVNNTSIAQQKGATNASSENGSRQNASIHVHKRERELEFNDMHFYIKIPYNKEDVKFLKTLKKSYWSSSHKKWICKATVNNLEALQLRFEFYDEVVYERLFEIISTVEKPYQIELYYMPQTRDMLCVKIEGNRPNLAIIKSITNRQYDSTHGRWIIPNNQRMIDYLIENYIADGAVIKNNLKKKGKVYAKSPYHLRTWIDNVLRKLSPSRAQLIKEYSDSLISRGYMPTTVKQYTSVVLKYMDYLRDKDLKESSIKDYESYISGLYKLDFSDSLVNTYNSALKYCFKYIIIDENIVAANFKRPKKRKKLPTILSVNEVDRLLRSSQNIKHTTILYTLYSSGLRLNELLQVKLEDIWWDRNQIMVRGGKGKKDRVVILANQLKELLIKYYEEYKPEYWLFEGHANNVNYSSSSVQKVIRRSAANANISKRTTPHTLRHCYATHMMDNGVGVRYIQELLGHKDIKTTLIYTHVTNNQISQIESPLDQLIRSKGTHLENNNKK